MFIELGDVTLNVHDCGAGDHWMQLEAPETVNALLLDFLDQHRATSTISVAQYSGG